MKAIYQPISTFLDMGWLGRDPRHVAVTSTEAQTLKCPSPLFECSRYRASEECNADCMRDYGACGVFSFRIWRSLVSPKLTRPTFHRAHCVPQEGGRVQGWESEC